MKRLLAALVLVVLAGAPTVCQAGCQNDECSWLFRRSYYSHYPVRNVHIGPKSVDGPYFTRRTGAMVTGGFRQSFNSIQIPGTFDNTNTFETWVQTGVQF